MPIYFSYLSSTAIKQSHNRTFTYELRCCPAFNACELIPKKKWFVFFPSCFRFSYLTLRLISISGAIEMFFEQFSDHMWLQFNEMHVCSKSVWFAWAHDKKTVLLNCWSKWMKSTAFRRMRDAEFILAAVHGCSATAVTYSRHNCSDRRSNAVPWDRQRTVMRLRPIALEWRIWPDAMPTCVCCHHFRWLMCPSDRPDPVRMMEWPALLQLLSVAAHAHYSQFYWRNPFVCAVFVCYKE